MVARSLPGALAVPAAALLTAPDGVTSVMLESACPDSKNARDRCALQREVKTGIRDEDRVQIVEGLHEGDKIVASGAYGLPDKSKITTAEVKPEAKNEKE